MPQQTCGIRVGLGYDRHRMAEIEALSGERGRPMVMGGVPFEYARGPVAHSDGDALMHAITDAVLGAAGLPDIGQLFPDKDPKWQGAGSEIFLAEAVRLARAEGWAIGNVDATVIVEGPKLGPRKAEVRQNLARVLGVEVGCVNVKGKTHELMQTEIDPHIEAMAVVLMQRTA